MMRKRQSLVTIQEKMKVTVILQTMLSTGNYHRVLLFIPPNSFSFTPFTGPHLSLTFTYAIPSKGGMDRISLIIIPILLYILYICIERERGSLRPISFVQPIQPHLNHQLIHLQSASDEVER